MSGGRRFYVVELYWSMQVLRSSAERAAWRLEIEVEAQVDAIVAIADILD